MIVDHDITPRCVTSGFVADPELRGRAQELRDRLGVLSEVMESADAFCAYVRELNAHDVLVKEYVVTPPDVAAVRWVHAGIIRAAIGTIMACLDPQDSRGNRASVGQIIQSLKDETLAEYFANVGQGSTAALQRARESYEDLLKGDLFDRAKRLRNDVVGHILIRSTPTPKVRYEDVYNLRDAAERIVTDLLAACGHPKLKRAPVAEQAKFFWDTHLLGIAQLARRTRRAK